MSRIFAVALFALSSSVCCQADTDRFMSDFAALCRAPHRMAGSSECGAAADYVAGQLRAAGIEDVILQPFFVPVSESRCVLRVDGREFPLFAMRANLWQLPVSGSAPIKGRTLFAGDGSPDAYRDGDAFGKIVILEYETARRWRDAFAMGARAVVFVETGAEPGSFLRHEGISADLPRFYMRAGDATECGLLGPEKDVEIEARGTWSRREAQNVLAWIPGADPVFDLQQEEAIVLSAQLDSFGEAPELARGARNAANCAALLEMARRLNRDRPRRSVLIAFLGAESRCLAGASALYSGIFRFKPFPGFKRTHADFIDEHQAEKAFLSEMIAAIKRDDIMAGDGSAGRQGLELLRRNAESEAQELQSRLRDARLKREDRAGLADDGIMLLERNEKDWNGLRRALARGILTPDVRPFLDLLRERSIRQLEARGKELDDLIRHRRADEKIGSLLSDKAIVLHLAVDFSDRGPRWGVAHGEKGAFMGGGQYNNVGYYSGVFAALSELVEELGALGKDALRLMEPETARMPGTDDEAKKDRAGKNAEQKLDLMEPETAKVQLGPPVFFPANTLHAGQMASRFGVYGLSLGTCHDPIALDGHPHDSPENVDEGRIESFANDAFDLVAASASASSLSLRQRIRPTAAWNEPEWTGQSAKGCNAMTMSAGSAVANRPAAGALLAMSKDAALCGFDLAIRHVVDQNGCFAVGPTPEWSSVSAWSQGRWCCVLLDEHGRIVSVNSRSMTLQRIEMFPCRQYTVMALAPPDFWGAKTLILNAANDGQFQAREFFLMEAGPVTTFFVPEKARGVKLANNMGLLLLNAGGKHPGGIGFELGSAWHPISSEDQTASDLLVLNEHRLEILRKRRITNDSLEWLHGLAGVALKKGREARTAAARCSEAWMAGRLCRRIYGPVLDSMNDLVKAVVLLLLLTIPFAYSLERLLVGTPHIYRRIGWYCFFFFLTFLVLYNVHPAFAIAAEPIVIFLAFVIIMLSAIVIFILLSRFQSEIKMLQGLRATVHSADVSRFGTLMAATAMGISTMRRRPIRTVLTTATVILLTFSILSFASFDAQVGIHRRYVGATEDSRCIFIHHALWSVLSNRIGDVARYLAGNPRLATERRWVAASTAGEAETFSLLAASESGDRTVRLKALVGLETADIERQPALKACFPGVKEGWELSGDGIYLPPSTAEALRLAEGDRVMVHGRPFRFAGAIDVEKLTRFAQIDATPVFPVDPGDASMAMNKGSPAGMGQAQALETANMQSETAFLPYYSANDVGFIHSKAASDLGGRLVAVAVYPDEKTNVQSLAERLARVSSAPVYATLSEGVHRLYFTTVLSTSGMRNLAIPVVLGGLIVFGTMLGSVADREKEIYSFSSLGLAPAHIGMLFFAEASVYAVVGGLGGYLLAQVVAFVSGWLSTFTSIRLPEMNYSSTNAIFAILVVMATVLLSTVYPAMIGARSANPGVARAWRLPAPTGDSWEFAFPFTVSDYDITGVMHFLYEHFNNFSDCSLGVFLAEGTRVFREGRCLNLAGMVATAPFDLGVTEDFMLTSVPSEIEGVDEVRVVIRRLSGTVGDWRRTNRPFISDLRKQFLIWRSLPAETMEMYRRKTLLMLGETEKGDEREKG